jgi:hypothetical protein
LGKKLRKKRKRQMKVEREMEEDKSDIGKEARKNYIRQERKGKEVPE